MRVYEELRGSINKLSRSLVFYKKSSEHGIVAGEKNKELKVYVYLRLYILSTLMGIIQL